MKTMRNSMLKLGERLRTAAGALTARRQPRGQSLVIVAMAFIGLAAMVGLAIDGGILFISQAHLRRAVDAAAVAAATQMRVGQTPENIQTFALQFIKMNGVDPNTVQVSLYDYNNGEGVNPDGSVKNCHYGGISSIDPDYDRYQLCTNPQRKFIRVAASTVAKFAFMPMMGIVTTTVTADAVSESASVDAVIVVDTSGSMGDFTTDDNDASHKPTQSQASVNDCNAVALHDPKQMNGNCRPLMEAKEAAKILVRNLYPGYDRVAIVSFNFAASIVPITDTEYGTQSPSNFSYVRTLANRNPSDANCATAAARLTHECDDNAGTVGVSESTGIYKALDSIKLNYDKQPWLDPVYTGTAAMNSTWTSAAQHRGQWNPLDYRCNWMTWSGTCPGKPGPGNTNYPNAQDATGAYGAYSTLSTCTGCGIRVAGNILKLNGRPSALWVVVFLSDGAVNVSDVPDTGGADDAFLNSGFTVSQKDQYPNGYCGAALVAGVPNTTTMWNTYLGPCVTAGKVLTPTQRICAPYHLSATNCPPGATFASSSPPYDVMDYAQDMIDSAALQTNCPYANPSSAPECQAQHPSSSTAKYNYEEQMRGATGPSGSNMAIYAIGLGDTVKAGNGQALLRYMAAVGDDGDRVSDPCLGVPDATSCGNYYYASKGGDLGKIFEDIAVRVFTRLTK
jgi:Flp pilus assembly protein TadG